MAAFFNREKYSEFCDCWGTELGLLEQEVADLWAFLRQFPEMKSSDLICAKAAIMRIFAAIC